MTDTSTRPPLPDHLSIDPRSPHYHEAVLQHSIGIRFNDKERVDVEEYRKGQPLLIKLKGRLDVFYR